MVNASINRNVVEQGAKVVMSGQSDIIICNGNVSRNRNVVEGAAKVVVSGRSDIIICNGNVSRKRNMEKALLDRGLVYKWRSPHSLSH